VWADNWLFAAFADPVGEVWGLVRGQREREAAVGRLGSLAAAPADATTQINGWNPAPELELTVADDSAGPVAATADGSDAIWLLRINGTHGAGGERLEIDAPAVAVAGPKLSKLDSVRILAAWFQDDRAIALSAVRPRGGHADKDVVSVLVTGAGAAPADPVTAAEPEPLQVFDPRLSTTYDGRGIPLRAGLELWLGPDEDSDQRPLRLSAQSTGDRLAAELGDLHLDAYGQRCHNRGDDGVGIYALLRPR